MSKITYFVMPISVMLMMLFVSLAISGIFGFDDNCPIASNFPNVKVNYSSNTRIIVDREKVYLQESEYLKSLEINDHTIKVLNSNKEKRNLAPDICPRKIPKQLRTNDTCITISIDVEKMTHHALVNEDIDYMLFSYRNGYRHVSVVCAYSRKLIMESLDENKVPKMVLDEHEGSEQKWLPYNELPKIPSAIELMNPLKSIYGQALINLELNTDEEIVDYQASTFYGLGNKTFVIHILATNQGRIIKSITKDNVEHHFDLWCQVPGVITQIEIYNNSKVLILTHSMLISLPIEHCDEYGYCMDCIQSRDPQCAWKDGKRNQCVNILDVPANKHSTLLQDFEHGNAGRICKTNSPDHNYNSCMYTLQESQKQNSDCQKQNSDLISQKSNCDEKLHSQIQENADQKVQILRLDMENEKLRNEMKAYQRGHSNKPETSNEDQSSSNSWLVLAVSVLLFVLVGLVVYLVMLHRLAYDFGKHIHVNYTRMEMFLLRKPTNNQEGPTEPPIVLTTSGTRFETRRTPPEGAPHQGSNGTSPEGEPLIDQTAQHTKKCVGEEEMEKLQSGYYLVNNSSRNNVPHQSSQNTDFTSSDEIVDRL
uniref:Sema domain-containing protein n=1 Tax=Acrobeloides nanus TaxID=290746 RepID=A0A914CL29_9BILA